MPSTPHYAPTNSVRAIYPVSNCSVRLRVDSRTCQAVDLGWVKLSIRVAKGDPRVTSAQRRLEAAPERGAVPHIHAVTYGLNMGMQLLEFDNNTDGVIVATVVNNNEGVICVAPLEIAKSR